MPPVDNETIAMEFAADVAQAVAGVRELTDSATGLTDAAKGAADGVAGITEPAVAAGDAVKGVADSSTSADEALTALRTSIEANTAAVGQLTEATLGLKDAQAEAAASADKAAAANEGAAVKSGAAADAGLGKYKTALVGIGVGAAVAVDGAVKYQAETTRLVTSAGESAANLDKVRQGMLALSSQTDESTAQLSSGMYLVESAGFHGAQGLEVLKASAQGAKDEGAELSTVANGVTDALTDFHEPASQAATVTSQLIAGVSHGKTTFEEFSGSMSTILPLASSMHLSLADVTGVLAEMTAHGMSARQAADDEANAMRELMKPNAAMVKEWSAMGITAADVNKKLSTAGLGGTLQWMSGIAQDGAQKIGQSYNQALGKMIGTAAGLQVALMTTGENAKSTNAAIHDIASASADAQGNVEGFSTVSQTAAFRLGAAGQATKAMGISLGEALLPAVMAVIGPVTSFLQLVASNQAASIAFALVIGGILAGAIGVKLAGALKDAKEGIQLVGEGVEWLAGKMGIGAAATEAETAATEAATVAATEFDAAADANPIGLIIMAVVALIAVIVLLVTHWRTVWHDITAIVDDAVSFIRSHWALLLTILLGPLGLAIAELIQHWQQIEHDVMAFVNAVVTFVSTHWREIVAWLVDPIGMAVFEIRTHLKEIENAFDEARHAVASVLDGARHDVASAFDDVRHSIAAFVDWLPGFIEKGFELAVKAQLTMLDTARHDVAVAFDDIRHSVSAGVDDVLSFFQKLPGQVVSFLASLPGQMLSIGENVIKGLINGIVNAAAAIPSIMGQLASDVASYFTDPLKLFSPSRLFFEHGWNIVQGAINGVKANARNLLSVMGDLGTGVGGTGSALAASAIGPASGSTSVHVNIPVTATGTVGSMFESPEFQQYMQQQTQEAVLRYAQLNPTNGLTPAWGQ
jgi:TP901 family phage tail tape measure protein